MAYFDNIPLASEAPADTRPKFVQNFQSIKALLGVDHKNFGDLQQGKHDKVTLPERAEPTVIGNDLVLFNKLVAGKAHVFAKNATTLVDLTGGNIATDSGKIAFSSGLKLVWGSISNGLQPNSSHTFNYHTPFTTAVYSVFLTPRAAEASAHFSVSNATTTTVTYFVRVLSGSKVPCSFYYLAIGE